MKPVEAGGFSLVEVVVAIGLSALAMIACLGMIAATARSGSEIGDAQVVGRLAGSIQDELERLQTELGLDGLAAAVPAAGSPAPLQLVATRDGSRALCAGGPMGAADRPLDDPALPGIARRDRYFLIELTQSPDLPAVPESGFVAVNALVTWPYCLPGGKATPGATAADADAARELPRNERGWLVLNFALPP
jgi:hypothetical protein